MWRVIIFFLGMMSSTVALTARVEVATAQYLRSAGTPSIEAMSINLKFPGELRISNINLQNGPAEISGSTRVSLNGAELLSPFHLPAGGFSVFDVEAGQHELEVVIHGKPGGGIRVAFYENQPDNKDLRKGWELLADGTVLHKKTGLIWHRSVNSPGIGNRLTGTPEYIAPLPDGNAMNIQEYIEGLNAGLYGTDAVFGNAGYSDWRAPTSSELWATLDFRVSPPFTNVDGEIDAYSLQVDKGYTRGGYLAGMKPGAPLYICPEEWTGWFTDELVKYIGSPYCPDGWIVRYLITAELHNAYGQREDCDPATGYRCRVLSFQVSGGNVLQESLGNRKGSVWPVRGAMVD